MKRHYALRMFFPLLAMAIVSAMPASAQTQVNLNINVGAPPVVVAEPVAVAPIAGAGVYFVPNGDVDLFFHAGFWWSPRGDRWYRASSCTGPWVVVQRRAVPRPVVMVPKDYRVRYAKAKHIPYGQWKKNHRPQHGRDHGGGGHHGYGQHESKGRKGHGHDEL